MFSMYDVNTVVCGSWFVVCLMLTMLYHLGGDVNCLCGVFFFLADGVMLGLYDVNKVIPKVGVWFRNACSILTRFRRRSSPVLK